MNTPIVNKASDGKKLIRGSSLMLLGRFCSLGINFLVQVLVVRALEKSEFGAFAYAMSIMTVGSSLAVMGLGKTLEYFVPKHQERGEFKEMAGTVLVGVGTVIGAGLLITALMIAGHQIIERYLVEDALSLSLVLLISVLIPFEALNSVMEILFAVFTQPRSLFVRRFLVGPGLKLAATLTVFATQSGVRSLAIAYVTASVCESVYSIVVLQRVLVRQGLWTYFRPGSAVLPFRKTFASSLPMALSDLLPPIRAALVTVVLEYFHGALLVAAYRAVFPVARLNHVTLDSFKLLFTPAISRHHARGDRDGIVHAYWTSSAWVAVITFPFFILCVVAPEAVSSWLFGSRYASSGPLLAIMTVGFYISAVLGLGRHVLRVDGRIAALFWSDLLSATSAVGLTFLLVPSWGAFGGALATAAALVIGVVANQLSLWRWKVVRSFDRTCLPLFGMLLLVTLASLLVRYIWTPGTAVLVGLAIIGSLAVGLVSYSTLDVADTFPEIARVWKRLRGTQTLVSDAIER